MLTHTVILKAAVLVCGVIWCQQVIARLPRDLREFRTAEEVSDRFSIGFWWIVSAGIAFAVVAIAWPMLRGLAGGGH